MVKDLFVSYARLDNAQRRITEFVEALGAEHQAFAGRPLEVFFDKTDIHGMEDWRHRILLGLRQSRLLLAFLSPAYFESEWCEWEFNEYLKNELGQAFFGDGIAPIYFVEVPGLDSEAFRGQRGEWIAELRRRHHFDFQPWSGAGVAALREAAVAERLDDLKRRIRERIERGERAEQSLGNVDGHNARFAGRRLELRRLREQLSLGRVGVLTAVHGLGGVGKTALATEYAHAFAHEYGGGRWLVRCEGQDDLRLALAGLHGAPGLAFEFTDEERLDLDKQFDRVVRELRHLTEAREPHACLLILDNVDQPGLLAPDRIARLPRASWLHVLATSRLGEKELHGQQGDRAFVGVDELPEADALELIESFQPGGAFPGEADRSAALEIVRLLGGFPLAVEAAAVHLGEAAGDGVTCAGFLALLREQGLAGLDAAAQASGTEVRHGEMRLRATWLPSLERLTPAERCVLDFAALLAPDAVGLPWLRELAAPQFPELGRDAEPGRRDPWTSLLRRLFSLRLLQAAAGDETAGPPRLARMHRLLQDLLRREMAAAPGGQPNLGGLARLGRGLRQLFGKKGNESRLARLDAAVMALAKQRADALVIACNWREARWEVAALEGLALLWEGTGHEQAGYLLFVVGTFRHNLADFAAAEVLCRRGLAFEEATRGPEHPDIAMDCLSLAMLLLRLNRFDEAEPLLRRAVAIAEKSLGPDHPDVAAICNCLALLLLATSRLGEAETLMLRALAIMEKHFGPDHPEVTSACLALSNFFLRTDRLEDAERYARRALEIEEADHGPDHADVSLSLIQLGGLLRRTGRLAEAEPLLRRAVALLEGNFGADHPNVAMALGELTELLVAKKCYDEAEPLCRRALASSEAAFGPDQVEVSAACSKLASLLMATHRWAEAEPLLRRALAITETCLGPASPDVATEGLNLAVLLGAMGRPDEAEPLFRRALDIFVQYQRSTGFAHGNHELAVTLYTNWLRRQGLDAAGIAARLTELGLEATARPEAAPEIGWEGFSGLLGQAPYVGQAQTMIDVQAAEAMFADVAASAADHAMAPRDSFEQAWQQEQAGRSLASCLGDAFDTFAPTPSDRSQEAFMHTLEFSPLEAEAARPLLALFASHLEPVTIRPDAPVRAAPVPFYPGYTLYAVPLSTEGPPQLVYVLHAPGDEAADDVVVLNWTNEPLYSLNERLPIRLEPSTLVAYLKFFFHFVRGQLGAFNVVERPQDVVWLPEASEEDKKAVNDLVAPVVNHGLGEDNLYRLTVTVLFKNALFRTDVTIAPFAMDVFDEDIEETIHLSMGQLTLCNEELLLEELPVPLDYHQDLSTSHPDIAAN